MKKMLSIDGSTTSAGYSLITIYKDNTFSVKDSGFIKPSDAPKSGKLTTLKAKKEYRQINMATHMIFIIDEINSILLSQKPDIIVIEDTYLGKDPNAYKWLCRLQGVLIGYSKTNDLDFFCVAPSHWRKILEIPSKDGNKFLKRPELKRLSLTYVKEKLHMSITNEDQAEGVLIGVSKCTEMGYNIRK